MFIFLRNCVRSLLYMLGYILFHCWDADLTDFCVQYKTFLKHLTVCQKVNVLK